MPRTNLNQQEKQLYTAIVLNKPSQRLLMHEYGVFSPRLRQICQESIPGTLLCHHVTINTGTHDMGPMADTPLGTPFEIKTILAGCIANRVAAAMVTGNFVSHNRIPHITLVANLKIGAKPVESNDIKTWIDMPMYILHGTLEQVHGN
jgi:hypothetical protein